MTFPCDQSNGAGAVPVWQVDVDSTGGPLPRSGAQTIVKNGSGQVTSITLAGTVNGVAGTWVQTVAYPDANTTVFSQWVKQ